MTVITTSDVKSIFFTALLFISSLNIFWFKIKSLNIQALLEHGIGIYFIMFQIKTHLLLSGIIKIKEYRRMIELRMNELLYQSFVEFLSLYPSISEIILK